MLFQPGNDKTELVRIVGQHTVHAAFDILLIADVFERTAAMFAQLIERTITKQAVERSGSGIFVTRKKSAFPVFKKFVTVFHKKFIG